MSDYFGALLRSAGALPADARARSAPSAPDHDPFEQAFEQMVEPAVPGFGADADTAPVQHAQAGWMPAADASAAAQGRQAPHQSGSAPSTVPLPSGPANDAGLHLAVQAALRWVAADPAVQAGSGDVADSRPLPALHGPVPASLSRANLQHERYMTAAPPSPQAGDSAAAAPSAAARPLPRAVAVPRGGNPGASAALAWQDAARPAPAAPAPTRSAHAARDDRVEVSIGSIHVSVDAPPAPRAVLQSAPLPRPGPAQQAPRSDFARSRLPRG